LAGIFNLLGLFESPLPCGKYCRKEKTYLVMECSVQSRIRDVRRAKGLTLADVAERCNPPTTAQTIGRLETGMRVLSLTWINRIADALGVDSSDLVALPDQQYLPVAAVLHEDGTYAPTQEERIMVPNIGGSMVGLRIAAAMGEYRRGDELWLEQLQPDDFTSALNLDVLVPRPGGRFIFGRLLGRDAGKLHLLPLEAGARQQVVTDPAWIAKAVRLVRKL
jgi:transcriptional regulator with XRE-family HTH domain